MSATSTRPPPADGNALSAKVVAARGRSDGAKSVVISAKIESEIALLDRR